MAPDGHRLLLLPSGPDRVHGPSPHGTEPPRRGFEHEKVYSDKAFLSSYSGLHNREHKFKAKTTIAARNNLFIKEPTALSSVELGMDFVIFGWYCHIAEKNIANPYVMMKQAH